jgi:CxxC-x17-CxxC domain-containing protein
MDQGDRRMYDVDLNCAECNSAINQLPFEPTGDKPVYCTNCLRQRRQSRGGFNSNRGPRQMFEVNEQCSECGKAITQLPFQPTGEKPIYCFDCNKSRRGNR